jgi:hypothetical protein
MAGMSLSAAFQLLRGTRSRALYIDAGVVNCPRQGDIDMDVCLSCPDLVRFNEGGHPSIECRGHRYGGVEPYLVDPFRPGELS